MPKKAASKFQPAKTWAELHQRMTALIKKLRRERKARQAADKRLQTT